MVNRRTFVSGLLATGFAADAVWSDVGTPSHLSAARTPQGDYRLIGLRSTGDIAFSLPLPARGHAAAAHPNNAEAVAFARRPGTYALVINCRSGRISHRLEAPSGHHFYGHGTFSLDGEFLFTTENHIASGAGRIGVWSRSTGYTRQGEFASRGIGPHEIIRLPTTTRLAVANGGIRTHPDSGRDKLNLERMRPNLSLFSEQGELVDRAELPHRYHQNSLRHLAGGHDGTVACGFQWQGDVFESPPLAAIYEAETGLRIIDMSEAEVRALNGYVGSVAALSNGQFALTSPRGGTLQIFSSTGRIIAKHHQTDICGVAATGTGGLATDGTGGIWQIDADFKPLARYPLAFDNHLVRI